MAGVQGPAGSVERVFPAAAVPVAVLLDPAPAAVQSVAREADDWGYLRLRGGNGSITATASGSSSVVAVLNPVTPSIATTSSPARQVAGRAASQVLNACLERPSTESSSREGPVRSRIEMRSMTSSIRPCRRGGCGPDKWAPHGAQRAGIVAAGDCDAV